jgi:hypothetical protein
MSGLGSPGWGPGIIHVQLRMLDRQTEGIGTNPATRRRGLGHPGRFFQQKSREVIPSPSIGLPSILQARPNTKMPVKGGDAMFCCPNCFAHSWLKAHVNEHSDGAGDCEFCEAQNVPVVDHPPALHRHATALPGDPFSVAPKKPGARIIQLVQVVPVVHHFPAFARGLPTLREMVSRPAAPLPPAIAGSRPRSLQ